MRPKLIRTILMETADEIGLKINADKTKYSRNCMNRIFLYR